MLKLKSAVKKLPSFTKKPRMEYNRPLAPASSEDGTPACAEANLCPVYVGKSGRRYLVSPKVVDHPLFREIADKSTISGGRNEKGVAVSCEVVLFEHLLWMLESDGGGCDQPVDELVEYYTC